MVAGRSLSLTKMVFTLVCTWIGSGTFIAGAEYASYAGWSAIWQPAGAFVGMPILAVFCLTFTLEAQHVIVSSASRAAEDEAFAPWAERKVRSPSWEEFIQYQYWEGLAARDSRLAERAAP